MRNSGRRPARDGGEGRGEADYGAFRSARRRAASLQIWTCGYRARCSVTGCNNLARIVLARVAPGGAPDGQSEFCHQHVRAGIAKATADGVGIYDMRTTTVRTL
jgi:hypothetical protein